MSGCRVVLLAAPVVLLVPNQRLAQVELDSSFGTGGVTGTFAGHDQAGVSVAIQTDGKILLGDPVWRDDGDGIQQDGEEILFQLLDGEESAVLEEVASSPYGHFAFTGLSPGCYVIRVCVPPGVSLSPVGQGDRDLDSDFDPMTWTSPVVVYPSGFDLTWDAGLIVPTGHVSADGFECEPTGMWSSASE